MQQEITAELAQRFTRKIATYTEYNVNVINAKGIIIAASRDADRIGTFHEAAFNMIKNHIDSVIIRSDGEFEGTRPGVNLLIVSGGLTYGVVGISGAPDEVCEIAMIIKMALETTISYEKQQIDVLYRRSAQEQFYMALFLDNPPAKGRLEVLASRLSVETDCIRVPILLQVSEPVPTEEYRLRKMLKLLKEQDLCWSIDERRLLIYYKLNAQEPPVLSFWQNEVTTFIRDLCEELAINYAVVGTLQNRLYNYGKGYKHCRWAEENLSSAPSEMPCFFYDHVQEYFASIIPEVELSGVYNVYDATLGENFKQNFRETIDVMEKTNYSLIDTSKQMYLHKNTIAFRMNHIRETLGIQPAKNAKDRSFSAWLLYYLKLRTKE